MNKIILTIVAIFMLSGCGSLNFSGSASGSIKGAFNSSEKTDVLIEKDSARYSVNQQNELAKDV